MKYENDHGEPTMMGEPRSTPPPSAADMKRGFQRIDPDIPGEGSFGESRYAYSERFGFHDRYEHGGFLPRDHFSNER